MKDDRSIYIFMKIMCLPVYLPDVLPDHNLDHKTLHKYKNKTLPGKVLEEIICKFVNPLMA